MVALAGIADEAKGVAVVPTTPRLPVARRRSSTFWVMMPRSRPAASSAARARWAGLGRAAVMTASISLSRVQTLAGWAKGRMWAYSMGSKRSERPLVLRKSGMPTHRDAGAGQGDEAAVSAEDGGELLRGVSLLGFHGLQYGVINENLPPLSKGGKGIYKLLKSSYIPLLPKGYFKVQAALIRAGARGPSQLPFWVHPGCPGFREDEHCRETKTEMGSRLGAGRAAAAKVPMMISRIRPAGTQVTYLGQVRRDRRVTEPAGTTARSEVAWA